jgi:hypothetical protein
MPANQHRVPGAGRSARDHPHLAERVIGLQELVNRLERAGLIGALGSAARKYDPDCADVAIEKLKIFATALPFRPTRGRARRRSRLGFGFLPLLALGVKPYRPMDRQARVMGEPAKDVVEPSGAVQRNQRHRQAAGGPPDPETEINQRVATKGRGDTARGPCHHAHRPGLAHFGGKVVKALRDQIRGAGDSGPDQMTGGVDTRAKQPQNFEGETNEVKLLPVDGIDEAILNPPGDTKQHPKEHHHAPRQSRPDSAHSSPLLLAGRPCNRPGRPQLKERNYA